MPLTTRFAAARVQRNCRRPCGQPVPPGNRGAESGGQARRARCSKRCTRFAANLSRAALGKCSETSDIADAVLFSLPTNGRSRWLPEPIPLSQTATGCSISSALNTATRLLQTRSGWTDASGTKLPARQTWRAGCPARTASPDEKCE